MSTRAFSTLLDLHRFQLDHRAHVGQWPAIASPVPTSSRLVGSFPPNGYDPCDMARNVCGLVPGARPHREPMLHAKNPRGGIRKHYNPRQPAIKIARKVMKGGCHLGFRCIVRPRRKREALRLARNQS